ncbi:MAG TPA: tetratricopeptide repeat protein [Blastocatellia bacterium]|nr:tetratricopeptide repeat protein [Blastocatellia bacterium]
MAQAQQRDGAGRKKVPQLSTDDLESGKTADKNPATGSQAAPESDDPSRSLEYLERGSAFYLKRDFKNAIIWYQKALELEKKNQILDQTLWRVLVDNLGMSYGITGKLKEAKAVFEYGLSKDPSYPMFHYNLACTFAEMGDVDQAVVSLRKAFEYKENMIPGEHIPNPRNDSSFKRFLDNEKFLKLLEEIGL